MGRREFAGNADLPSEHTVAAEFTINPLTVLKAYQNLADEELVVKKRRGLGMFVKPGARKLLLRGEWQHFLTEEWPRIAATIQRLGLSRDELLDVIHEITASVKTREKS